MMHSNPHLMLMGAIEFSALDLHTNRQGQLSSTQRKQLEERRLLRTEGLVVAMLLLLGLGVVLHIEILPLLFLGAVVASLGIGLWQRTSEDLREQVEVITGKLEIASGIFPLFKTKLQMDGEQLQVSRRISAAFLPGHIYRAYVTAGSHTLLSAEILS